MQYYVAKKNNGLLVQAAFFQKHYANLKNKNKIQIVRFR